MTTFSTSREIPASVEQVFAAFNNPERLARWRWPAGFTNTFSLCEFKEGGRWSFAMHGPDGVNYPNQNVFAEMEAPNKVVVQHVSEPKFRLTTALASSIAGLAGQDAVSEVRQSGQAGEFKRWPDSAMK